MKNWKIKGKININIKDLMLNQIDPIVMAVKYIDQYYQRLDFKTLCFNKFHPNFYLIQKKFVD